MSQRISRTKLARYVASELLLGRRAVIRELAAYLVDTGRTAEIDLVVRAIYAELESAGVVMADVTTAHRLDQAAHQAIKQLTGAKQLELHQSISSDVLGGIRVSTPTRVLDATLQNRLMKLRERKV